MSNEECQSADWHTAGYDDAVRGFTPDRVSLHTKACTDVGITPDSGQYAAGHAEGARIYCSTSNAFKLGRAGRTPAKICPADLVYEFNASYQLGYGVYVRRRAVDTARRSIWQTERDIARLERDSAELESKLASSPSAAEQDSILSQLDRNRSKRKHLVDDLRRYERDLNEAEREYEAYTNRSI